MFLVLRAATYATFFIGFVLIALPARLAGWSNLQTPAVIGWPQSSVARQDGVHVRVAMPRK